MADPTTRTRGDYLATARSTAVLLADPAVAAAWRRPSALLEFTVHGLAGHLAYQVLAVPPLLDSPVPTQPTTTLLGHYERVPWMDAGVDDEFNVGIRRGGEDVAAGGPERLAARVQAAVESLAVALPVVADRPVRLPLWGDWSLRLDDFLVTRMMELAVHSDDLAVSVGVEPPPLPAGAVDAVVDLLSRLAVRRHGATAVIRAFSRAERAPASVAAF